MNKYSPLAVVGLLFVPLTFCVVYAQNGGPGEQNQFDAMLKQSREDTRKTFMQDFIQKEKQYEEALRSGSGRQGILPGPPNLKGTPPPSSAGGFPPPPPPPNTLTSPAPPLPSATPTPGTTPNFYVPTPSNTVPPVAPAVPPTVQPPTSAGQSSMLPPANPNIYR